jgi:hypothetical protein
VVFVLKQVFQSKLDVMPFQELDVFFLKSLHSMMFSLIPDIILNGLNSRIADGERTVALLPLE